MVRIEKNNIVVGKEMLIQELKQESKEELKKDQWDDGKIYTSRNDRDGKNRLKSRPQSRFQQPRITSSHLSPWSLLGGFLTTLSILLIVFLSFTVFPLLRPAVGDEIPQSPEASSVHHAVVTAHGAHDMNGDPVEILLAGPTRLDHLARGIYDDPRLQGNSGAGPISSYLQIDLLVPDDLGPEGVEQFKAEVIRVSGVDPGRLKIIPIPINIPSYTEGLEAKAKALGAGESQGEGPQAPPLGSRFAAPLAKHLRAMAEAVREWALITKINMKNLLQGKPAELDTKLQTVGLLVGLGRLGVSVTFWLTKGAGPNIYGAVQSALSVLLDITHTTFRTKLNEFKRSYELPKIKPFEKLIGWFNESPRVKSGFMSFFVVDGPSAMIFQGMDHLAHNSPETVFSLPFFASLVTGYGLHGVLEAPFGQANIIFRHKRLYGAKTQEVLNWLAGYSFLVANVAFVLGAHQFYQLWFIGESVVKAGFWIASLVIPNPPPRMTIFHDSIEDPRVIKNGLRISGPYDAWNPNEWTRADSFEASLQRALQRGQTDRERAAKRAAFWKRMKKGFSDGPASGTNRTDGADGTDGTESPGEPLQQRTCFNTI